MRELADPKRTGATQESAFRDQRLLKEIDAVNTHIARFRDVRRCLRVPVTDLVRAFGLSAVVRRTGTFGIADGTTVTVDGGSRELRAVCAIAVTAGLGGSEFAVDRTGPGRRRLAKAVVTAEDATARAAFADAPEWPRIRETPSINISDRRGSVLYSAAASGSAAAVSRSLGDGRDETDVWGAPDAGSDSRVRRDARR